VGIRVFVLVVEIVEEGVEDAFECGVDLIELFANFLGRDDGACLA
jgi:hypothetical protein